MAKPVIIHQSNGWPMIGVNKVLIWNKVPTIVNGAMVKARMEINRITSSILDESRVWLVASRLSIVSYRLLPRSSRLAYSSNRFRKSAWLASG